MSKNRIGSPEETIKLIDVAISKTRKRNARASLIALALETLMDEFPEYTEMYLYELIDHIKDTY